MAVRGGGNPMLDDLTFLQVIGASPDDDGPRLLYADYLEEKGDPAGAARAEFIRVQCALNAAGPEDVSAAGLRRRERALLTEHWRAWLKPACQALGEALPDGPGRRDPRTGGPAEDRYILKWLPDRDRHDHVIEQQFHGGVVPYFYAGQFRRGFLAHAGLTHKESRGERHVARLWEKSPLDGLSLAAFDINSVDKTLSAIDATRLRSLELIFTGEGPVETVARHPKLGGLRELVLKGIQGGVDLADVLGRSATLTGLRVLVLDTCTTDDAGIARLCQSAFAAALERLELRKCGLTNAGAAHLAREWPAAARLAHLDLTDNRLGSRGLRELGERFGDILTTRSGERLWPTRFYL
jgi:uncharacterized protein (TIGR02996 family)